LAWADVRPMLVEALPLLVGLTLALGALEYAFIARAIARPRRRLAAVILSLGVAAGGPLRHGTTENRTADAATSFARPPDPRPRTEHRAVPPLGSKRARVPNILYVITESV